LLFDVYLLSAGEQVMCNTGIACTCIWLQLQGYTASFPEEGKRLHMSELAKTKK
jgi:hypothetical protein